MQTTLFLDVEAGENCPYSMQLVFSALEEPRPVHGVRVYHREPSGALFQVTGWDADGPCPAQGVQVEDSGQAVAYLVYGGEGGIRFRPAGSERPWSIDASDQWGESHVLMADETDVDWA